MPTSLGSSRVRTALPLPTSTMRPALMPVLQACQTWVLSMASLNTLLRTVMVLFYHEASNIPQM